jgi:hypothetical protein
VYQLDGRISDYDHQSLPFFVTYVYNFSACICTVRDSIQQPPVPSPRQKKPLVESE